VRRKQETDRATHVLCACEALAVLRFRHLGHHFLKPGDFADISVSKVLHFAHSAGLLNAEAKEFTKGNKRSRCKGHRGALFIVL
jgi:hypothetical protein